MVIKKLMQKILQVKFKFIFKILRGYVDGFLDDIIVSTFFRNFRFHIDRAFLRCGYTGDFLNFPL